jgi:Sybindin-like family
MWWLLALTRVLVIFCLLPTLGLHSVRTAAGTLHNYETISGMRFALYTNNNTEGSPSIRSALQHIYTELWVELVVRSPLYRVGGEIDVKSTNFEQKLDVYLSSMPWFRT